MSSFTLMTSSLWACHGGHTKLLRTPQAQNLIPSLTLTPLRRRNLLPGTPSWATCLSLASTLRPLSFLRTQVNLYRASSFHTFSFSQHLIVLTVPVSVGNFHLFLCTCEQLRSFSSDTAIFSFSFPVQPNF